MRWWTGDEEDDGVLAFCRGGTGLVVPALSSEELSKSGSRFCAELRAVKAE